MPRSPGDKRRMASRKRGPLTSDEKSRINQLAETMKNPTVGKVARLLDRLPSTINWYMLSHGLIERKPGRASRPYKRNGRTIYPYAIEHDRFIVALRSQDPPLKLSEIADRLTTEFGITRDWHSVSVRLVQLAAAPDEAEAA